MKLIVKIGLIVLLLMFNYQGVDADVVSSAIDRYATTTEHQDNMASDHGTLDTMSFTHSLRLSGNFWLLSFKISYLCLPLFYETRTTPSCHPSGCAYRQL